MRERMAPQLGVLSSIGEKSLLRLLTTKKANKRRKLARTPVFVIHFGGFFFQSRIR